jgi:hypothetical protein
MWATCAAQRSFSSWSIWGALLEGGKCFRHLYGDARAPNYVASNQHGAVGALLQSARRLRDSSKDVLVIANAKPTPPC